MHDDVGAKRRRIGISVLAAVAVMMLSGCGVGALGAGAFFFGTKADDSARSQEAGDDASAPPTEQPSEPEEEEEEVVILTEPVVRDEPTEEPAETPIPEEIVAGTIELSIESGGTERVLRYDAGDCFVSEEYILASGKGADVATGESSEVGIGTTPAELLHERTGTYQAQGVIRVTIGDEEIVSDGRPTTLAGHTIDSTFTYRHDFNSAHYVVEWFSGPNSIGAGYVDVNCDY